MANSSSGGGRAEAERWLEIAGRLLAARDLVGSKRFAERAMEADPKLDGVDAVLSVADVLLASQRRIGAHHVDWYAVLGVDQSAEEATIRQEHRRLATLLRPEVNSHAGAEAASHLVADALTFLTDPSKKKILDNELKKQSAKPTPPPKKPTPAPAPTPTRTVTPTRTSVTPTRTATPARTVTPPSNSAPVVKKASASTAFWTACPFCCHLHQYAKSYKNRSLLCPNSNCRRPFHAAELPVPPPIVPGTDTYYSAWGFFPMGYPKASDLDENWKPFHPVFPWNPDKTNVQQNGTAETPAVGAASASTSKGKKTMAKKKVGRPPKRQVTESNNPQFSQPAAAATNVASSSGGNGEDIRGININETAKAGDGAGHFGGGDEDMGNFHIDVDTTDELLGNLQNLPFLRDEVVPGRIL